MSPCTKFAINSQCHGAMSPPETLLQCSPPHDISPCNFCHEHLPQKCCHLMACHLPLTMSAIIFPHAMLLSLGLLSPMQCLPPHHLLSMSPPTTLLSYSMISPPAIPPAMCHSEMSHFSTSPPWCLLKVTPKHFPLWWDNCHHLVMTLIAISPPQCLPFQHLPLLSPSPMPPYNISWLTEEEELAEIESLVEESNFIEPETGHSILENLVIWVLDDSTCTCAMDKRACVITPRECNSCNFNIDVAF